MSKPVVIACTCGGQSSNWWKHEQNCAMKLAGLLSEARAELAELREAAQDVVETMRGSGGINPDAAEALLKLAELLEGKDGN